MSMPALLEEVTRRHFPNPPATPAQIEAFEQRVGWRLDPDLRAFYLHCDGAKLFDRTNPEFAFYPLAKIRRARMVLLQDDTDRSGPESWYALCELVDSNYILLDVSHQEAGRYPLRDGYREAFPDPNYCSQIAASFSEFLAGALRSNGSWFWLPPA
ncbi:SMI1/KNR4 family protein [Myxococcus sp. AM009]|uniref:SMI1/KNR4 family protein n=1 Tax=unclassified Myxococcus TaxID=2648731 RepID=UPI001595ABA3|nr:MULTISPECIES: SMI1/KNR4 family protein [unclassified Myxococcus]NVI97051.1 SMI1/KNR4 family protein [Myxococcus sp. AM009]NVJ14453.1 SMI1/KNR4 family protein [Myxococcus sp. AM010]